MPYRFVSIDGESKQITQGELKPKREVDSH